uniref:Putative Kazal-type Serine protease inhibitor n=1 Tax=Lutzomyia longipalpis TaxID=7200 RepID=A8CW97_LUTLO|nr:putative Kazal-type serine protease inhibitor [Lutzomyia longipalpis]
MKIAWIFVATFALICTFSTTTVAQERATCPCPRIYMPVCGSDDVTYSNKCEFECAAKMAKGRSLRIRWDGPCDEEELW